MAKKNQKPSGLTSVLDAALASHQGSTRTLIIQLHDLFEEQDLLNLLNDPGKTKVSQVYEVLYRMLLEKMRDLYNLHTLLKKRRVVQWIPGILPPDDTLLLYKLKVVLNCDVEIVWSNVRSDQANKAKILKSKGTRGVLDLTVVKFKAWGINLSLFPAVPVKFVDSNESAWIPWTDLEPEFFTDEE